MLDRASDNHDLPISNGGFSAMDLLLVFCMTGILCTLMFPLLRQLPLKASLEEARLNISLIASLENTLMLTHGSYAPLDRIGRGSDGAIVCTVTNNAIGFTPEPCTAAAAAAAGPVPRYGYQVLAEGGFFIASAIPTAPPLRNPCGPDSIRAFNFHCNSSYCWEICGGF